MIVICMGVLVMVFFLSIMIKGEPFKKTKEKLKTYEILVDKGEIDEEKAIEVALFSLVSLINILLPAIFYFIIVLEGFKIDTLIIPSLIAISEIIATAIIGFNQKEKKPIALTRIIVLFRFLYTGYVVYLLIA